MQYFFDHECSKFKPPRGNTQHVHLGRKSDCGSDSTALVQMHVITGALERESELAPKNRLCPQRSVPCTSMYMI